MTHRKCLSAVSFFLLFWVSLITSFAQSTAYLSDYEWEQTPTTGWGVVRKNHPVGDANEPLKVGGESKPHGFGTHSFENGQNAEIIYNLNNIEGGGWTTFSTLVGRDDEADGCGCGTQHLLFKIFTQATDTSPWVEKRMMQIDYSNTKGWQTMSNIDVSGQKRLKLVVLPGGDEFWGDHADWGEPQLSKSIIPPTDFVYLSDFAWEGTPTSGWGSVLKNHPVGNASSSLTVGGVSYSHGFGTHSYENGQEAAIIYDLTTIPNGPWTTFSTFVGRDDEADGCGCGNQHLQFKVFTQATDTSPWVEKRMMQIDYSNTKGWQTMSNIDVSGQKRLKLVVLPGGDEFWGDHADWGEPKLSKNGGGGTTCSTDAKQIVEVRQECNNGTFDINNGSPNNNGGVTFNIIQQQYPSNCVTTSITPSSSNSAPIDINNTSNSFVFRTNGANDRSKTGRVSITLNRNNNNYTIYNVWSTTCDHQSTRPDGSILWENVDCPTNDRRAVITAVNDASNTSNFPEGTEIYVELKDSQNNRYKITSVNGGGYNNIGVSSCIDVDNQMKYRCTVQSPIFTLQVQPDKFQSNLHGTCHGWTRYYYFGNSGSIDNPNARIKPDYNNESSSLNLFPNTSENYLSIKFLSQINKGNATVGVFNSLGILQFSKEVVIENYQIKDTIETQKLPSGEYLLRIIDNGNVVTKKFIKQ